MTSQVVRAAGSRSRMHWMSVRRRENMGKSLSVQSGTAVWGHHARNRGRCLPCHAGALLQYGFGNATQDVDFLLRDLSAVEQGIQSRHELLGRDRVQKTQRHQRL